MKWVGYILWIFYVIIQGGKALDTTSPEMVIIIIGMMFGLIVFPLTFLVESD